MFCPNCGTQAPDGTRFCQSCGQSMQGTAPGMAQPPPGYIPPQQGYAPPPGAPGYYAMPQPFYSTMVYDQFFDLNQIPPDMREQFKKHTLFETFSVGGAIALHFVTLGIFSVIFYGMKHSRFPRVRPDDFTAGKAIGFLFIPFFNLYWIFVFWLRLVDRVNFQFRLRNQPLPVSRGLALAAVIVGFIPYVGLVSWLVLYPIMISELQGALNTLAMQNMAMGGGGMR